MIHKIIMICISIFHLLYIPRIVSKIYNFLVYHKKIRESYFFQFINILTKFKPINKNMKERIAVISGFRSAMGKAGGAFKNISASDLGAGVAKETILRSKIDPKLIDEVIIGNVAQPADSANIARVIALKAGVDQKTPAYSVYRNCASCI
jgi:3-oxoacyl-[acyl-carrier-protein] synthase III